MREAPFKVTSVGRRTNAIAVEAKAALLAADAGGDVEAYREAAGRLVDSGGYALMGMIRGIRGGRRQFEFEDLYQEIWTWLPHYLRTWDPARSAFITYFTNGLRYRVKKRAARLAGLVALPEYQLCRRRGAMLTVQGGMERYFANLVAPAVESGEDDEHNRHIVSRVLLGLSDRETDIVRRFYGLDGCGSRSHGAIARELGTSQASVSRMFSRAMAHLKSKVGVPA